MHIKSHARLGVGRHDDLDVFPRRLLLEEESARRGRVDSEDDNVTMSRPLIQFSRPVTGIKLTPAEAARDAFDRDVIRKLLRSEFLERGELPRPRSARRVLKRAIS